jgi:hypothetical protein
MPTTIRKRRRLNSSSIYTQHYVYMATRSKQSATDSNSGQNSSSKVQKERSQWTSEDEKALVQFLLKHKSEAGDGANFKNTTWSQVAKEMDERKTRGGEKTAEACKTKWIRVRNVEYFYC